MNMQNLLNKLSALTTESLTMAGGSHAPAALAGLDEADEPLDEATMCEVCGNESCVCESDYSADDPLDETTMCEVCSEQPCACACGSDQLAQDGSAELAQLKQMMGGQMPMAAAPVSGMNVTTNVDSTTGNKTVTVTADGPGAEDLMRILGLAGIAVAPAPAGAKGMAEQLANAPDPVTLDAQTQLVGMSGGPNAPHGQYNPDRARDNSMTFVDESVDRLASNLRAKFIRESQGSGSEKIKEDRMPVWKRDALIMVTKTKYPKLYAAIKGVNNGTAKGPFSAYYVDDPTPPSNETEFKNNLDKLQQRLDKLEKIIGTDEESKSKELKNFLASFKYEERPKMDHSKYVDPSLDKYGYPRPGVFKGKLSPDHDRSKDPYTDPDGYPKSTPRGWKPASERSEEDDWLH